MYRLNKVLRHYSRSSILASNQHYANYLNNPFCLPSQQSSARFINFYQVVDKEAMKKERARIADEMNRGYFQDMEELKKHAGKVRMANKVLIPAMVAAKFPNLDVRFSDGRTLKLPFCTSGNVADADESAAPKVTVLCLGFRASSQAMIDSWTTPFLETFKDSKNVHLYQVSMIDSWFLSLKPVRWMLMKTIKKSKDEGKDGLQRQTVYSFGDHYYFRKELKILNLLTGYIFLLDKFGRVRWEGFGLATPEEVSTFLSCSSSLLEE